MQDMTRIHVKERSGVVPPNPVRLAPMYLTTMAPISEAPRPPRTPARIHGTD